jgi:hypothetical protein
MLDRRDGVTAARDAMRAVWREVEGRMRHVLAEHFDLRSSKSDVELAERLARFIMACIDGALVDSQIDPEGTPIPGLFADLGVALESIVAAHRRPFGARPGKAARTGPRATTEDGKGRK